MSRALILTLALLLACMVAALAMGRYPIPLATLVPSMGLGNGPVDPVARMLLWHERLPRVIAAVLVGAGLGSAGASFQVCSAILWSRPICWACWRAAVAARRRRSCWACRWLRA
jgi:ABC-type enterobactin transport system permease subunit